MQTKLGNAVVHYRLFTKTCLLLSWIFCAACALAKELPKLVVQTGHTGFVMSVAFSPDGKTLVSGGLDKTLRLWDISTGLEVKVFSGGDVSDFYSVAFSPDGKFVISSNSYNLLLWDVATGLLVKTFSGPGLVNSVAFSRDGKTLVSGSDDKTLRLWDVVSGREIKTFKGHADKISIIAFSPDGKTLVSGSDDQTLRLWDVAGGREIKTFKGHSNKISTIAFSPDGKTLVSGSSDQTLRLWDVASGRAIKILGEHKAAVTTVAFSPDGKTLVSGSFDQTLRSWDVASGHEIKTISGHNAATFSVAFSPDGKTLVSGDSDEILRLRDVATGNVVKTFKGYADKVSTVAISPDAKTLVVSGSWDKTVRQLDLTTGSEVKTFSGHPILINSVAISPDGKTVASGNMLGAVQIWDLATGLEVNTFKGHTESVTTVVFSPDGKSLVSGSWDKTLRMWDVAAGVEVKIFKGHTDHVQSVAFSPNGKTVISGSFNDALRLWDVVSGLEVKTFKRNTDAVSAVAFSPDGKTLASGSLLGTLRLWDVVTGLEVKTFNGHGVAKKVNSVVFSPDGKTLVSGSTDKTVRLWDVVTGREVKTLNGHTDEVAAVTFMPDGKTVVSAGSDARIKFWTIDGGQEVASLTSFLDGSWAVTESNGRYDSSNRGENPNLHWVIGQTPIGIEQLKDRYYDPGLLSKLMGFNKEPLRNIPALAEALAKLPPSVELRPGSDGRNVTLRITDEGGGVGRVRVRLNGKELIVDARGLADQGDSTNPVKGKTISLTVSVDASRLVNGNNTLDAFAFNEDNHIQSRLASINLQGPVAIARAAQPVSGLVSGVQVATEPPTLYVIAVGVSKYAAEDGRLNLAFSGKDAVDLSQSLLIAGKRLFGAGQVNVRVLTDADATVLQAAAKVGQTVTVQAPGRTQVAKAFADVAKEAKANDIVVVFLGGHGVMTPGIGLDTGDYHYLMPEARSADLTDPAVRKLWAVSSAELTEWTKAIKANKQVLVLDTCAAGGAVDKLVQQRALPGSHTIALERLKDRTGFHILAGSAADKVSYEASRYGQGLLTYALLAGLRGAALRDGEYADVSKLFQYAVDQVPELAKGIGGIQKPMVASPRGSSFDIGRLVDEDKRQVPVAKIMPLMLRSQIQSDDFKDTLRLEARLNARLREFNYSGAKGELMFVDADEHPDGWKLRARYRKASEGYVLEGVMFQGGQERGRVKVELKSDEAGQVERLIATLKTEINE